MWEDRRQTPSQRQPDSLFTFLASHTTAIELLIVTLWVLWVGKAYLNFDAVAAPAGREFAVAVFSHHFWGRLLDCGWCALWDGSSNGGFPAFANVYSGLFHPITAVSTLLFGVVNGSKWIILVSLWTAGFAQWWLAKELGLGSIARVWTALVVVVGGHLASRMDLGLVSLLLSTSMASLFFPAFLALHKQINQKALVVFALVIGSIVLAGQGYSQFALLLAFPATLVLILEKGEPSYPLVKKLGFAIGLGLLMASLLLIPVLHFAPNFDKWADPNFETAQSISYAVLNLVIGDHNFYHAEILGRPGLFSMYPLFVGWLPVLFAAVGLGFALLRQDRKILFLAASVALMFIFLDSFVLKWLVTIISPIAGLRFSPYALGLVITPLLGMAAFGFEQLWRLNWPSLTIGVEPSGAQRKATISLRWVLIAVLLIALKAAYDFSAPLYYTTHPQPSAEQLFAELSSDDRQWVAAPFGEHYWVEAAIGDGLSLIHNIPYLWKDRQVPLPRIEAHREQPREEQNNQLLATFDGMNIHLYPDEFYAEVVSDQERSACRAQGLGGNIQVECDNKTPGLLVVKENMWTGWKAWMDGSPIALQQDAQWLSVDAPAGRHSYLFRYLPVDVPLGLAASALGIVIAAFIWTREFRRR